MSQAITPATGLRAGEPPPPAPAPAPEPPRREKPAPSALRRYVLEPLASLRLTVWLFALSLFLVFVGTLAQAESGNLTVINDYFRSFGLVWVPFQLFVKFGQVFLGISPDLEGVGGFPFPGGWLLGGLLMTNLLAAHAIRFRFTWKDTFLLPVLAVGVGLLVWSEMWHSDPLLMWSGLFVLSAGVAGLVALHTRKSGVLVLHLGLVVMMLSEFVTGVYAVEGTMTLVPGEVSNFVDNNNKIELAVIDRSDSKVDTVIAIPQAMLRPGETISHPDLPFDLVVDEYMANSNLRRPRAGDTNKATRGDGRSWLAIPEPETSGTESRKDIPSAYVTVRKKGSNEALDTYLVSLYFYSNFTNRQMPDRPQAVKAPDGKEYHLVLRPERTYRHFSVQLLEFRHDRFQGTNTPKNFSSLVRVHDPQEGDQREVKIWMNHPLRYAGETFYQSGVLPGDSGTILQVVRNPGWLMPYVSCAMVSVGMMIHFGLHLGAFLRRRAAA